MNEPLVSSRSGGNLLFHGAGSVVAAAIGLWQLQALAAFDGEGPALVAAWWHIFVILAVSGALLVAIRSFSVAHAKLVLTHTRGFARYLLAAVPAFLLAVLGLYLWEAIVTGFGVPVVLLPGPRMIAGAISAGSEYLWADFVQTVVKSVLPGYVIGCGSGVALATLAWRFPALGRGLLPLGSFMSVMPIVGVAPIMVMWFGFDWQSKAAVAALMTFFPMLVNSLAGFNAGQAQERDLMHTYAASRSMQFTKLVLPAALPFLFNGLKVCSTLALIGAIVAEFFGTPIVGMGFRISSEVGRMGLDVVWATIAVSAVVGTSAYGLLAALERALTFWDASLREAQS